MNLLAQMSGLLTPNVSGVATIVGQKQGLWVGQTVGGGVVLLSSQDTHSIGQKVYYNTLNRQITGNAPSGDFKGYGV